MLSNKSPKTEIIPAIVEIKTNKKDWNGVDQSLEG